jgi:hypothetical protein
MQFTKSRGISQLGYAGISMFVVGFGFSLFWKPVLPESIIFKNPDPRLFYISLALS